MQNLKMLLEMSGLDAIVVIVLLLCLMGTAWLMCHEKDDDDE